jgi:hypothetical protein
MKKLTFLFLALTILLQSCYTYSSLKTPKDQKQLTIQEQIKPEHIYKIEVDNKTYTIDENIFSQTTNAENIISKGNHISFVIKSQGPKRTYIKDIMLIAP